MWKHEIGHLDAFKSYYSLLDNFVNNFLEQNWHISSFKILKSAVFLILSMMWQNLNDNFCRQYNNYCMALIGIEVIFFIIKFKIIFHHLQLQEIYVASFCIEIFHPFDRQCAPLLSISRELAQFGETKGAARRVWWWSYTGIITYSSRTSCAYGSAVFS